MGPSTRDLEPGTMNMAACSKYATQLIFLSILTEPALSLPCEEITPHMQAKHNTAPVAAIPQQKKHANRFSKTNLHRTFTASMSCSQPYAIVRRALAGELSSTHC